jgi:hypothetical protein
VTDYDIATLAIATAGLGLAMLSLGWQAATFVLSGSRVRVDILKGSLGRGSLITGPPDTWQDIANISALAAQGFTEEVLAVEVRNVGRMPVSVEKVTASLANGIAFEESQYQHAPLPYRLEPGSSQKWWVTLPALKAALAASGLQQAEAFFSIGLGTGKIVQTKRTTLRR